MAFARVYKKKRVATLVECESASVCAMVEMPDRSPVAFADNRIIVCPLGESTVGLGKLNGRRLKMYEISVPGITAIDVMRGEDDNIHIPWPMTTAV